MILSHCIDNRYKRMGYGKMLLDYSLEKAKVAFRLKWNHRDCKRFAIITDLNCIRFSFRAICWTTILGNKRISATKRNTIFKKQRLTPHWKLQWKSDVERNIKVIKTHLLWVLFSWREIGENLRIPEGSRERSRTVLFIQTARAVGGALLWRKPNPCVHQKKHPLGCHHQIFLRHCKMDSKILLSFTFFLGNTQFCLQSIGVCFWRYFLQNTTNR